MKTEIRYQVQYGYKMGAPIYSTFATYDVADAFYNEITANPNVHYATLRAYITLTLKTNDEREKDE